MTRAALALFGVFLFAAPALTAQPLTRAAATSLRLPSSPPATNYAAVRAFPTLSFDQPVAVVTPPDETRRLFIVEKTGRIWVIPDVTAESPVRMLFLDLSARIATSLSSSDERGLLALAFHPAYATNGQFFLWFTINATTAAGTGLHDRLARFRVSASDPNVADAISEQPLISQRDESNLHNGGQLGFGPDGYLYLSIGDEGGANDQFANSQRIDRDFFSGVLRLDADRRPGSLTPNPHAAVHAGTYAIPPDNPWVGATTFNGAAVSPTAVRTEFWAVGLRNPWRFSFDSATGRLWLGDVGEGAREEIDVIVRGGNYGWNYREGFVAGPRANPTTAAASAFLAPIWDYPHTQGGSITGGFVYRGSLHPALFGKYLFADFVSGRIWALEPDGEGSVPDSRVQLLATDSGIASFGLNPATGDILLVDYLEGAIKRLAATGGGGPQLPATLSATGAFTDVAALTPAAGVVAYEPRVSAWADYARVRRWFALPDLASTIHYNPGVIGGAPAGSVFMQHFDLELQRGNPATARRVETRFLVLTNDGGASAFSFRWNDAQTDATLVPEAGDEQTFTIADRGVLRTQVWRFPSRNECLTCHVSTANLDSPFVHYALSFNFEQLNREYAFPGGTANILSTLGAAGYFDSAVNPELLQPIRGLALPDDTTRTIDDRAFAYLNVNCGACHRPNGSAPFSWTPVLNLLNSRIFTTSLGGGTLRDNRGDPANRYLVPGDIVHSELFTRMAGTRAPRMPSIATRERDREGERLLVEWIISLQRDADKPPGTLANLAARAPAGAPGRDLITGFVVGPGARKTVLIRAVGPRLADFGVNAPLREPMLTLLRGSQLLANNARWNTAPNAADIRAVTPRVGAFSLPEGSADSALMTTLDPGDYTAHVTNAASTNDAGGTALLEVYDADAASPSRLANLSIRARIEAGSGVLIPGLVVNAGGPKTLLIRAIGPGLREFGVPDFVARPTLAVFSGPQDFAENTAWASSPRAASVRAAAQRVGAFSLAEGSADSALLVSLSPGPYTIQVAGASGTAGVALIEVYEVP